MGQRKFSKNKRVIRRQLCKATLGYPSTIAGALVTLVAFYTLWMLILFCADDRSTYKWIIHELETGDYAIAKIEAYRDSNDGRLPETLEIVGFRKTFDNIYWAPFFIHGYGYGIEYVKLNDTSYFVGFQAPFIGKCQYLSSEKEWRIAMYEYYDTFLYEGPDDMASMYLYEYELNEPLSDLLSKFVGKKSRDQQYLLTLFTYDTVVRYRFTNDSVPKTYNAVFQTFEASQYNAPELFSEIDGYTILNGHICFITNKPWHWYGFRRLVERNFEKGRLFTFPKYEPCVGGEQYWLLDLESFPTPKATFQGYYNEE